MLKIKPIEWKKGIYGTNEGYMGKTYLFSISYDAVTNNDKTPYILTTTLPQIKRIRCKDIEEGKQLASEILTWFIQKFIVK